MKIYFERSGGFMGQRVTRTIDVETLPRETAESLMRMVEKNNYFTSKQATVEPQSGMPVYDQFHFKVTIETEQGEQHTVEAGDQSASPELQPFLHELSLLAHKPQAVYDKLMAEQQTQKKATPFPKDYPPETNYSPDDF